MKPRITRCEGYWVTMLGDDVIFADILLREAFRSAQLVWRYQ